ncbi:MAG: DUF2793 domain-containing protein [Novosphingobium sp.]|nr:DUF2793 domain-containing protein [Novosphingobium sp.]
MPDPLLFTDSSPRFGLPMLYAGQAQKEVFVNEANALTDALLHCAIEGISTTPPATPTDGESWLVSAPADGAWAGEDGHLACRQGGNWLFVFPGAGMRVLDKSTGQIILYDGSWRAPVAPVEPSGGSVVDTEARSAIIELVQALRVAGVFPSA